MYAFAAGYDWSRGADKYDPTHMAPKVSIRLLADGIRRLEEATAEPQT
jgi:hypothetical protein